MQAGPVGRMAGKTSGKDSHMRAPKTLAALVVRDAATGEAVREVTDQAEIERAFEPLSGINGLADAPEAAAEYVLELWQPETQKAGQDAGGLQDVKVLETTIYEGTSTVNDRGAVHRAQAGPSRVHRDRGCAARPRRIARIPGRRG